MTSYIRRIVSGAKARFTDPTTSLELDLVYVTPRVIIMGFPAHGMEGLYRNKREDVVKFLSTHHGASFWVWNLCPLGENGYDDSVFDGRVSRWPWPDHHAPPLAYLPLIAREMKLWLNGGQDRVAVIHCKAGKGRSGTVACSYLLLDMALALPPPEDAAGLAGEAKTPAHKNTGQVDKIIDDVPTLQDDDSRRVEAEPATIHESPAPSINEPSPSEPFSEGRKDTAATSSPASTLLTTRPNSVISTRPASVISTSASVHTNATDATGPIERDIPTPKTNAAPTENKPDSDAKEDANPTVVLQRVLALHTSKRMKPSETPNQKQGVSIPSQRRWLHYWAKILESESVTSLTPSTPARVRFTHVTVRMRPPPRLLRGAVTASFARYDDVLIDELEGRALKALEADRSQTNMAKASTNVPTTTTHVGNDIFDKDGQWDRGKMVRRFAEMQEVDKAHDEDEEGKLTTYRLEIKGEGRGVEVEAGREVRVKVYMGQAFLFWTWFVPSYELPVGHEGEWEMHLRRKGLDFPVGLGKWVVDVRLGMEWVD